VVGPDVRVLQFCGVEEYKTVWTMVSVIEGRISNDVQGSELEAEGELGWEVLRRSLPPGSMTGAPKKRSVEILQTLEDDERAIYSGVFGYWDVGGSGDWAVTIRSCFKHDEESQHPDLSSGQEDTWVIGAGGAITALSDPEAEWEEMMLKLQGVLRAFHDGDD
jgi:para-aminobenzoate synthetase